MINEKFVIIGALLNLSGSITYARSTIKGKTKPNRVTWFLWALAPLIAFTAQVQQGVGLQVLMTFMVGFGPLLVFIASFLNKKAYWQISRFDIGCGALSILALILWGITGDGNLAIALSIAADFLAGVPTLIKAYKDPATEHSDVYRNGALSAVITLLTISTWTFATYGFAVYIMLVCTALYVLIKFKLGKRLAPKRIIAAGAGSTLLIVALFAFMLAHYTANDATTQQTTYRAGQIPADSTILQRLQGKTVAEGNQITVPTAWDVYWDFLCDEDASPGYFKVHVLGDDEQPVDSLKPVDANGISGFGDQKYELPKGQKVRLQVDSNCSWHYTVTAS